MGVEIAGRTPSNPPTALPDYPVPDVASLADIVARGEAEFGDKAAFELPHGRAITYRELAAQVAVATRRQREDGGARGDLVRTPAMPAHLFAPALFAAAAAGAAVLLGLEVPGAEGHALGAGRLALASSGTSGDPKCVVLSQAGVVRDMLAGLARYSFGRDDRYVSVIPPTHAFGLTCDLLAPLAVGATICVPESPQAALARLADFAPTALNVPPQFARALLGLLRARSAAGESPREAHEHVTGGSLRRMLVGGAGLPAGLARDLRAYGIDAYGCYGLSECSPCVSVNRDVRDGEGGLPANRDGSAGLPLPCNEVRVADDGELLVRGANVMLGYLGRPDLTARVLQDGWLRTGDLGRLDEDGFLWVEGRKDDVIALPDGTLVSPVVWERALCGLPGVRQALVYAREGAHGTELAARLWMSAPSDEPGDGARELRDDTGTAADNEALSCENAVFADPAPTVPTGTIHAALASTGRARGARPASSPLACGDLVAEALAAARSLSADGAHLLAHIEATAEPLPTTALGKLRRRT